MCSPAGSNLGVSSSEGSLSESEMNSLPTATSPRRADDTEVLSRRMPEQEMMVPETPQGKIPDAGHVGGKTPMDYAYGSRLQQVWLLAGYCVRASKGSGFQ